MNNWRLLIILCAFFQFTSFEHDTTLVERQFTYKNDTMTRSKWIQYNQKHLAIYSFSLNYERNDTTEIYMEYDTNDRMKQYVVNGPYWRNVWDTTKYEYDEDTTITIQRGKHFERIRKEDDQGRSFYSSSKSYDDQGRLRTHKLDSTFYDDSNNMRINRSYIMEGLFKPKRTYDDDETIFPEEETEEKVKKGFRLSSVASVEKNEVGNAIEIITKLEGKIHVHCTYLYDSLDQLTVTDIKRDKGRYMETERTEYTYQIIGDTLIKKAFKKSVSKGETKSLRSTTETYEVLVEGELQEWSKVSVDGELFSHGYIIKDENELLKEMRGKRKSEGKWITTKMVNIYKSYQ